MVNRATSGGGVITPPDLMQELPDDVVELSWTEFSCLHTYFSKEAWTMIKSAGEIMLYHSCTYTYYQDCLHLQLIPNTRNGAVLIAV